MSDFHQKNVGIFDGTTPETYLEMKLIGNNRIFLLLRRAEDVLLHYPSFGTVTKAAVAGGIAKLLYDGYGWPKSA